MKSRIISNTQENSKDGFDIRIVNYEEIHNIKQKDFDNLVKVIDLKTNERLLDAGCGYGAVTREILKKNPELFFNGYLLDISPVQIQRAITKLNSQFGLENVNNKLTFIHDSIVHPVFQNDFFEKVVCKMVIHEIPINLQQQSLNEIYRILKVDGMIIVWDLILNNRNQLFFQNTLRKKDEIVGYKFLEKNRYFLREDELIKLLFNAGFLDIKKEANVTYEFNSLSRLENEFLGNIDKLKEWHSYIRAQAKLLSSLALKELKYKDYGDNIVFFPPKAIYSAVKK